MGELFYLSSIKARALSKTRVDRALRIGGSARVRGEAREIALCLREGTEGGERFGGDHCTQLLDGRAGVLHPLVDRGHAEARACLGELRISHAMRARRIEERSPRAQARAEVVQVDVLHLGEQLWEERIAWMAIAQVQDVY